MTNQRKPPGCDAARTSDRAGLGCCARRMVCHLSERAIEAGRHSPARLDAGRHSRVDETPNAL